MLENFLMVGQHALILFILMGIGYCFGKSKLLAPEAVTGITNLVLYLVVPCSLISAFQLDLTAETLHDFLLSMLLAFVIVLACFFIPFFLLPEKDPIRKRIFCLAMALTNCNFMAFPLQTALIGPTGIFYGSAYATVCPLLFWTGGVAYLTGDANSFSWRKALCNPGIAGIALGLFFFFSGINLPPVLMTVVDDISAMNIPLPMLLIGYQLSQANLHHVVADRMSWVCALLRLVLLPLGALMVMYLVGVRGSVLIATTVAAACPAGTLVAMMAEKCNKGARLAAELVSFQTLLSVITMPLVVGLAETLA